MKTKSTFYNSLAGMAFFLVSAIMGLVNRRVLIHVLGIECQGVDSLFGNLLSVLSIAELGIGPAVLFHLYRPLKENHIDEVKSLVLFYRKCYCLIAGVVFCAGAALIPFLDVFVRENPTGYPLAFLYIMYLADTAISYLFTFKRSVIIADQKEYLVSLCDIASTILIKTGQILILSLTGNFICYLCLMLPGRIMENAAINRIVNQQYPYLKGGRAKALRPEILEDILEKVKGSFFHKIGSFVVLGTDNLIISRFLGLAAVGIYSNYYLILSKIQGISQKVLTAATAGVGHMLTEENDEKNRNVFMELLILNGFLATMGASGFFSLSSRFVRLFFGETYTLDPLTVLVLSLNMYMQEMRTTYIIFKEASGIIYEDRFVPLIESGVNIIATLVFLKYFGMAGVFMGTITSSLILFFYTYPVFVVRKVLKQSVTQYAIDNIWMFLTAVISMFLSKAVCGWLENCLPSGFPSSLAFILEILTAAASASAIYILLFAVWKKETKYLIIRIEGIWQRKPTKR